MYLSGSVESFVHHPIVYISLYCSFLIHQVTLKVAVTYGPDVTVTWDGGGGLITQCALLVAVEWAQEVDIFLLPRCRFKEHLISSRLNNGEFQMH
jgi:hypothetical protein